jgi:hypothetical protein
MHFREEELHHREREHALVAYQRFVAEELGNTSMSPFGECNPHDRRILGGDDFAAKLLGAAWQPKSRKTLEELLEEACQQFAVTEAALCSRSSQRQLTRARAWMAHQATTLRVASLCEVARFFRRSESSLRESVTRHFGHP